MSDLYFAEPRARPLVKAEPAVDSPTADVAAHTAHTAAQPNIGFFPRSQTSYLRHRSPDAASARSPGTVRSGISGFSSDDDEWNGSVLGHNLLDKETGADEAVKAHGKRRAAMDQVGSSSKRRGSVSSTGSLPRSAGMSLGGKLALSSPLRMADRMAEHNNAPHPSTAPQNTVSSPSTKPAPSISALTNAKPGGAGTSEVQRQIAALQEHLKAFSQTLAAPAAALGPVVTTGFRPIEPDSRISRKMAELELKIILLEKQNKILKARSLRNGKQAELESMPTITAAPSAPVAAFGPAFLDYAKGRRDLKQDVPVSHLSDNIQMTELRQSIAHLENRNRVLHLANDRLRNRNTELESTHSSMADELSRLTDEQELNAGANERSRMCVGIEPGLIRGLAAALSTKDRTATAIAEEMFTLAESAMPYTGIEDVRREGFAPRERLRNVEGVLDVTLARMEMMEKKMKDINTASKVGFDAWGGGSIRKDVDQLSSVVQGAESSREWND